jgi:Chaperone of endosialidase
MSIQISGVQIGELSGGPVSLALSELSDVSIVSPQDAQYLRYNSSLAEWQNAFIGPDIFNYLRVFMTGSNGIVITYVPGSNTVDIGLSLTASGDATGTAVNGELPLTLRAINPNTGTYGSGSEIPVVTVNAKGLITGMSTVPFSSTAPLAENLAGGTTGSLPYQSAPNVTTFLPAGTANQILVGGASGPAWASSISGLISVSATTFTGNLVGNATTASALQTPRTIAATGDATWSVSFDGSAGATGVLTLATVNSNIGTFAVTTVNAKGLVTAAANLSGDATSAAGVVTLATVNAAPQANTFHKATVNAKGLVTATSPVVAADITAALTYTPVNRAGDTMTGPLILNADPSQALGAATKQYVDNLAAGLVAKGSSLTGTTATLATSSGGTVTYANGTAGVGATLTTTGSFADIGGATAIPIGSRILVKNEAAPANNGIYIKTSNTVLTRATDFDNSPSGEVDSGSFTFITSGSLAGSNWVLTTPQPITIGTTGLIFTQLSGPGTFAAGSGISISGDVITNTGVLSNIAGTGISVSGATGNVTIGNTGVVSVAGTASQITVSAATGAVTFSLPANVTISGTMTAGSFTGAGTGLTGTAAGLSIGGTAGNVNSITGATGGNYSWSGVNEFTGTGQAVGYNSRSGNLMVSSISTASATMTFIRSGTYALNLGLDTDNFFRLGGYSDGTNAYRIQISTSNILGQNYFSTQPGDGNGFRFWNSDSYKLAMGQAAEFRYGPVTDYSIKTYMEGVTTRGWTWGSLGATPVAAINLTGNMQIAGNMTLGSANTAFVFSDGGFIRNSQGSFGGMELSGSKASWTGVYLPSGGGNVIGMYNTSGNGGEYDTSYGWIQYWDRANQTLTIGDSTISAGYKLRVSGSLHVTGNILTNTVTGNLTGTASNATTLAGNSETVYLRARGTYDSAQTNVARAPGLYNVQVGGSYSNITVDFNDVGGSTPRFQLTANYANELYFRTAQDSPTAWPIGWPGRRIIHNANYNEYSPTLTGGNASGTWPINISGNAATATTAGSVSSVAWANITGKPARGTWASTDANAVVMGQLTWRAHGSGHTIFDASAGVSPDGGAVNASNSQVAWTGTYPTLMGWNGTNTYGARVDSARNADLLGGYGASTSATANTVVVRDANNYTYHYYINSTSPNSENPAFDQVIVSASDNWYRKSTIPYFTSKLSGTAPINITGSSASTGFLNSIGQSASTVLTGRNIYGYGAYTYNAVGDPNAPTTYTSAIGFGYGAAGSAEIMANWISGGQGIWYRTLRDTADPWTSWYRILDAANYNQYSPTLTGGNASGTWPINITGNSGNTSYIGNAVNNSYTWGAGTTQNFTTANAGVGTSGSLGGLTAYGGGAAAGMSFHIPGSYAINMGLDTDLVFRMGGWSDGAAYRWQSTSGGDFYTRGVIRPSGGSNYIGGTTGVYGALELGGDKNGWSGWYTGYGGVTTGMRDASGNGGVYNSTDGWEQYYNRSQKVLCIGGATSAAGYTLHVNGASYTVGTVVGANGKFVVDSAGNIVTLGNVSPPIGAIRLTPNLHLNAGPGAAVILNWDNTGGAGTVPQLRVGNGSSVDLMNVYGNGDMVAVGRISASTTIGQPVQGLTGDFIARRSATAGVYYFGNYTDRYLYFDGSAFSLNGGNLTVSGDVIAYSDIRVKKNIEVIKDALNKVSQIRGVTFNRTDMDDDITRHAGVIAQEVEKVLPEVVSESNVGASGEEGGMKQVAYGNMVGLLIEAIKELNEKVEMLKAEIRTLKA